MSMVLSPPVINIFAIQYNGRTELSVPTKKGIYKKMKKVGNQTILFEAPPTILETACIGGPKEANGPLAKYFDQVLDDEFWGEKSWEKAESKIIKETVNRAVSKSDIPQDKINFCFAGDLLNQCISSTFGLREHNNS